jgi:hypothetical protein
MNTRTSILLIALLAVLAAGAYHVRAVHTQSRLQAGRVQMEAQAMTLRSADEDSARHVAAAEDDLQRLASDRESRTEAAAASRAQSSAASGNDNIPTPTAQSVGNVPKSDLLEWQVQAYISEQRLRYARLLKRLGLAPEDLHAFDRIQGAYRKLMVDPTQNAAARKQAAQTRDDQLKALFGANHEQWVEAQRNEPARFVVSQIVQQTFQGSGALTTTQAEELEQIVAQHRLPASAAPGGNRSGYDWDQIAAEAQSILADQQQKDFLVAIEYRRASEQMSAMAAKKP